MASFRTFFHGWLTGYEITCIQSFLDHGHEIEIFVYDDCGAPPHFKLSDAARILCKKELFFYEFSPGQGSVSGFTNRFRYTLLENSDVWWVDTDVVCLSAEWPNNPGSICAAWEDDERICGAVLRADPEIAMALLKKAVALGNKITWGQAGPELITSLVREKGLQDNILAKTSFYPVHYSEWHKLFLADDAPSISEICAASYAVHLWNETSRRVEFDKSILPDRASYFGSLVARHNTEKFFRIPDSQQEIDSNRNALLGKISQESTHTDTAQSSRSLRDYLGMFFRS